MCLTYLIVIIYCSASFNGPGARPPSASAHSGSPPASVTGGSEEFFADEFFANLSESADLFDTLLLPGSSLPCALQMRGGGRVAWEGSLSAPAALFPSNGTMDTPHPGTSYKRAWSTTGTPMCSTNTQSSRRCILPYVAGYNCCYDPVDGYGDAETGDCKAVLCDSLNAVVSTIVSGLEQFHNFPHEAQRVTHGPVCKSRNGNVWKFSEMTRYIAAEFETVDAKSRPRCFYRHSWRVGMAKALVVICDTDPVILSAREQYGWIQCDSEGTVLDCKVF
jgi:hypothetical protein